MRCFMPDAFSLGLVGSLPSIRDVQLWFPRGCANSGGGQAEKEVGGKVLILLIPEYYDCKNYNTTSLFFLELFDCYNVELLIDIRVA